MGLRGVRSPDCASLHPGCGGHPGMPAGDVLPCVLTLAQDIESG